MIAIMAARADAPNYGGLIVYTFPKQKLVYGPRQIDARINQDPGHLRSSSRSGTSRARACIRGSLLAIPIEQSLIYVQPLYLAAPSRGRCPSSGA